MAVTYGLTSTGLQIKDLQTIIGEIEDELKSVIGAQINTVAPSVFSQIIGVYAERESNLWDVLEDVYNSQYPDTAEGVSLQNVGALSGLTFIDAAATITSIALFGTLGTTIPAGSLFSVENNSSAVFSLDSEVTLIAGTDEVQTITYGSVPTSGVFKLSIATEQTADINWDDAAVDIQTALNALDAFSGITVSGNFSIGHTVTFAGDDGKQIQPILIAIDNTLSDGSPIAITITETTPGVYQGLSTVTATQTGPTNAASKTLNQIDTPVSGLTRVFNPEDAIVGRDIETSAEFRLRRLQRLVTSLAGTPGAIRNAILALNDVTAEPVKIVDVTVFENTTLYTDIYGRPGKSFEAVVRQSNGVTTRDQEIGDAIFASKPAGIQSFGTVSIAVTDSQDIEHTVYFSRSDEATIYMIVDLTVDANYPIDGDDQVNAALVVHGATIPIGGLIVVHPKLDGVIDQVPGIIDITIKIGTSPAPTLDNNIQLLPGEISVWETANITVNS